MYQFLCLQSFNRIKSQQAEILKLMEETIQKLLENSWLLAHTKKNKKNPKALSPLKWGLFSMDGIAEDFPDKFAQAAEIFFPETV